MSCIEKSMFAFLLFELLLFYQQLWIPVLKSTKWAFPPKHYHARGAVTDNRQALIWNFGSFKVQSSKLLKTFAVFNMWPDTCLTWLPLFCIYWCYLSLLRCSVRVSISNRRASICACFALHSSRSPSKDRSLHLMQKRNWFLQASSRHEGQKDWQSPYPHTVASFSAIARFVQHDRQYLTSQTLHSSVAEQPVHRISLQWVQNE